MDTPYFPQAQSWRPRYMAAAPAAARSRPVFLWLVALMMATGTVVLIEPAPIDLALVALLCAGLLFRNLKYVPAHESAILLLGAFVVANAISMVNAGSMPRALSYLMITTYMLCWWLFFSGVVSRYGYAAVTMLMSGYVAAGVFSAMLGTLSYLRIIGHQNVLLRYGRPQGLFKDPNVYGPYMIPMLLWAIIQLQGQVKSGATKLFWLAVCVVSAAGIFLSYSRAAWINSVLTIAAFFLIQFLCGDLTRRTLKTLIRTAALVLVIGTGLGFLAAASPAIRLMLEDRLGSHGLHQYDNERFYTQRLAVESVQKDPLGIGPGQSEIDFNYSTHSLYLRVLGENGVLGSLAFYLFVGLSLARAIRMAHRSQNPRWRVMFTFLSACLIGLLVNSVVIDTLHWRHFWLLLGLAWASHADMFRSGAPERAPARPAWQGHMA